MKKIYFFALSLYMGVNVFAQQNNLSQFYENQKTPFLKGTGETYFLDGTSWERHYGEKEYVLTPLIKNINRYNEMIHQFDESNNGITKSTFQFIKVEINDLSKSLLSDMNIYIPNYIKNDVNVYLPQIDIDKLKEENINFFYLNEYGKNTTKIIKKENKSIVSLFDDDFETYPIGVNFTVQTGGGGVDCSWDDLSCFSHNGNWSAWCAANGTVCNALCGDYVSSMNTQFVLTTPIITIGYTNITLNFWLYSDMNNTGNNDVLYRFYDTGSGYQLSSFSYDSSHPNDGQGWFFQSFFISGSIPQYSFVFQFQSNSVLNSFGAYIDELEVTGDNNVGIDDIDLTNSFNIYPNPTNGIFSVEADNMERIEITSITGEIVKELIVNKNKTTIDLTSLSSGIYFAKIITDKGSAIKKIVLN